MNLQRIQYGGLDGNASARPSDDADFMVAAEKLAQITGYDEEKDTLKKCVNAAFGYLEGVGGFTNRTLINSKFKLLQDDYIHPLRSIYVPLPPLISVDAVRFTLADGTVAELAEGTDYVVRGIGDMYGRGRIVPKGTWPAIDKTGEAIEIEFTAGQGTNPSELPEEVQAAAMHYAVHRYQYGLEADVPKSPAFDGLLDRIRLVTCP